MISHHLVVILLLVGNALCMKKPAGFLKKWKSLSVATRQMTQGITGRGKQIVHATKTMVSSGMGYIMSNKLNFEMDMPSLAAKNDYRAQSHVVLTSDGYLLTLHRIPCKESQCNNASRPVVFLQHGLLASSDVFLGVGPSASLAYVLSDSGYDVWLGNIRGNKYSQSHITMLPTDPEFWNFNLHEIAVLDVPAMIDFVLRTTLKDSLVYVGHALGATYLFAMSSTLPKYNNKINTMIALAPIVFMKHLKPPIRNWLIQYADQNFSSTIKNQSMLPRTAFTSSSAKHSCNINILLPSAMCKKGLSTSLGRNPKQFNKALFPKTQKHTPATSLNLMEHLGQMAKTGLFQQFDYGLKNNIKHYSSKTPFSYELDRIHVPVNIFYSENDLIAGRKNVMELSAMLTNCKAIAVLPLSSNHMDFFYSLDLENNINKRILSTFKDSEPARKL